MSNTGSDLTKIAAQVDTKGKGLPPVEKWNPPFCGDIDMRIKRDGSWWYLGTPIGRKPLVKLFSTILRKDPDGKYYLVTPVERVGIIVEDAPFLAVACEFRETEKGAALCFTTNVDDEVIADSEHPIRVEFDAETQQPAPYILVRKNLEALIGRNVFYQLVEMAEHQEVDGKTNLIINSAGREFCIGSF